MVGPPDAFTEVRYLTHLKHLQAIETIPDIADRFAETFGRDSGGLIHPYRTEDADTIVVALGSVLGTICDTVDELRETNARIGALGITSYRPFPVDAVRSLAAHAKQVVVVEKAFAAGVGGIVSTDVQMALSDTETRVHTVVAGLGGRAITKQSLFNVFSDALVDTLEQVSFLDLNRSLIDRELQRMMTTRRSGPHAENMLADLGAISPPQSR